MIDRVRDFIESRGLLDCGDRVIVALSGGADSVVLLDILISLSEEYSWKIHAAHFNHGIRGEEADRDEAFVAELCDQLGIPLHRQRADIPSVARENSESEELCGRRLRYAFFEELCDRLDAKVATAHHRDDNAETVLWNLTRGTGPAGLSGIPARRDRIIRPLLCVSREEIEAYCARRGLSYVTDSTNMTDEYTRNCLRHKVMPVLRELNPAVSENIAHTAQLMREADEYLKYISVLELKRAKNDYGYRCEPLLKLEPILLKYAVRKVLEWEQAPVDFCHITLIMKAMRAGSAVMLGQGFTADCSQGTLRILRDGIAEDDFCEVLYGNTERFGIKVTVKDGKAQNCSENPEKVHNLLLQHGIPCDIITSDTVIRHRRAGDTFTDVRRGVTKTLKKLLNELKIPREKRGSLKVVACDTTVLWLEGVGTAAQAKADLTRDGEYLLIK